MERKASFIPDLAPEFEVEILRRDWERLTTYPAPASVELVKEFYTNAVPRGGVVVGRYLSFVRGQTISYDPDSINNFLGTEWPGEQCQYAAHAGVFDNVAEIEEVVCLPGRHFQPNASGAPVNIRRLDMIPLAQYWMAFTHANIQPFSHISDITIHRVRLIFCLMRQMEVNVGQIITDEIRSCAMNVSSKMPLGHPSLITFLCQQAGVNIAVPPYERLRNTIDATYFHQFCAVAGDEG